MASLKIVAISELFADANWFNKAMQPDDKRRTMLISYPDFKIFRGFTL